MGKVVVVKNNLPQSSIVFGQNGLARNHPDYYAAYLLNHILGGGGFIGGHLGKKLKNNGYHVRIADIKNHEYWEHNEICHEFIKCRKNKTRDSSYWCF